LPSASVSTRTIVAPETLPSAACLTLAAVSPLSNVSSLRWRPHGLWAFGAFAAGQRLLEEAEAPLEPDPLAALAIP
jgi:hypothetical protein